MQLIEPYNNRRVKINFEGIQKADKFTIDQPKTNYNKVAEKVREVRKKLANQQKTSAGLFGKSLSNGFFKSTEGLENKNTVFIAFTTVDRAYQLIDSQQKRGNPRSTGKKTHRLFVLNPCEEPKNAYEENKCNLDGSEVARNLAKLTNFINEEIQVEVVQLKDLLPKMRNFNENHCEVRVQKSVRSAADGGMTCADFGPSEFPRQPICTHLQGKPLNVVFYLDMSRNIRGYQLSFYAQMITSVLRHFAAVHISNKGENKITIKKYNKRSTVKVIN